MNGVASPIAVQALDPLAFPLYGSRLIEASAGTGKTYTIAALYVRLVLGHGGEHAYARALTPPEILVVTFTEAATGELRDRIRSRLTESATFFMAGIDAAGDDFLQALREAYPPAAWPGCARKLQLAAEWMDEAAVSTIHGWCNRMLREHAFDSDSLFSQVLEADLGELQADVVRDYWRTYMAPLDAAAAAEVIEWWQSPEALEQKLRNLIAHAEQFDRPPEPATALQNAQVEKKRRLVELKAPWLIWVDELQRLLDTARERREFNGQQLKKNHYDNWLQALARWRDDPDCVTPALSDTAIRRLTPAGLKEVWKDDAAPLHPALQTMELLAGELQKLPSARNALLRHAARWVARRFAQAQAARAQMGFNDLLTRLDDALQGDNGKRLAAVMRRQFPVAMIDEFQDTDPVQYRIFDAVYRVADNHVDTALILIGDPKQAIYAFRGADIHTYLAARFSTAGRHYTLSRNFRSTEAMVSAVNRCFTVAEARASGAGAFLFRTPSHNPIPFMAADATGREDQLLLNGSPAPALTLWHLDQAEDKPLPKNIYFEQMAAACASAMVQQLRQGQAGQAGFLKGDVLRALRPADMAVLVNNRREAEAMRAALLLRGVRSVYLSDQDSVFESGQAAELQHWLAACAEPDDGRLLRAALATPTLALSWTELDTLNHDEFAWDARILQFRDYRACWQRQGVLPMLRRLLSDFNVPARLLGEARPQDGERILTDLLHLAELLQRASMLQEGEHALIRYLAEQREDGGRAIAGDARLIRLESDADLVKIVTVHKSKGLEYPLVFLPFACNHRPTKIDDLPLKYHDDQGRLQLALTADADLLACADRERLGEDLRKLYVALTRARYATWLGVAPLAGLEQSAFGYLLHGGDTVPPAELAGRLAAFAGDEISLRPAPDISLDRFEIPPTMVGAGGAREAQRVVREHWWIASYSALKTVGGAEATTSAEDVFHEVSAQDRTTEDGTAVAGSLHALPRGAEFGSFLHDLLEWTAKQGFARIHAHPELLQDLIARRCNLRGWARWITPLTAWLQDFIAMPLRLPATTLSLKNLTSAVAEMEFWLPAHQVDIAALDRLVRTHTLNGAARPQLEPGQVNGMFKGFIDLVFEADGRYYVIDYKSNWLGASDAAYTQETMQAEILHARYELQYVLYVFALHRLLQSRLADYDYERHVGGAIYIFLRGLHAPSQGLHVDRPPRALITALDRLFAAQPETA